MNDDPAGLLGFRDVMAMGNPDRVADILRTAAWR
jgi:hypothetical protein